MNYDLGMYRDAAKVIVKKIIQLPGFQSDEETLEELQEEFNQQFSASI